MKLLCEVYDKIKAKGYILGNIDSVIALQKPKVAPYIDEMRKKIAEALSVSIDQVSVKATTTEKLGFVGREEGIEATAVVLVIKETA
jgi:2-C-methyl-D-erythritol 2,4-cyclodiphosphate synthase